MYILLACLSLAAVFVYGDDSKHYLLKYPAPVSIEPATHPVENKPHDSVGATYQAITKRHYTGAVSSSTTAEILNTITSPHSRSSVSFTTTSADHPGGEPPHHPVEHSPAPPHYPVPTPLHHPNPAPLHHSVEHSPSPPVYNPTPAPHHPTPGHPPIYHSTPAPLVLSHPTPTYYTVSPPPPSHSLPHPSPPSHPSQEYPTARLVRVYYPSSLAEHPISVPSQQYDLQHIVNDHEHSHTPSTYTYRIPPNQTDDYPPAPRVSPKAFSYQPVITLANNMKSFYKTFNYDPFVLPQQPAGGQYYASNYLNNNLIYPASPEVVDVYKSYPTSSRYPAPNPPSYPTPYAPGYPSLYQPSYPSPNPPSYSTPSPKLIKVFPSPVVSYNVSSAYPFYETSPTPVPILPRVPLSLPPPEGLSLVQGVPKPYKDNAYIEPQRPLFTPVFVFKKYSP